MSASQSPMFDVDTSSECAGAFLEDIVDTHPNTAKKVAFVRNQLNHLTGAYKALIARPAPAPVAPQAPIAAPAPQPQSQPQPLTEEEKRQIILAYLLKHGAILERQDGTQYSVVKLPVRPDEPRIELPQTESVQLKLRTIAESLAWTDPS